MLHSIATTVFNQAKNSHKKSILSLFGRLLKATIFRGKQRNPKTREEGPRRVRSIFDVTIHVFPPTIKIKGVLKALKR
jgi:hypothetical protein